MNKLFSGAYTVEFPVTGKRTYLPNIPYLRNKRIKHIDVCSPSWISKTPNNNILYNLDNAKITISDINTCSEIIQSLPCVLLDPVQVSGARMFINKIIDMQRSYIDTSEYYEGYSYMLIFYYDEPDVWGLVNSNERTAILPLECTLTGKKTYFGENVIFKNRKIQNLILEFPSITHSGKVGIASAGMVQNKFITLSYKNKEWLYRYPLFLLYQRAMNFPLRMQNVKIDLQSSFIETLETTPGDLRTVMFNVLVDDNVSPRR